MVDCLPWEHGTLVALGTQVLRVPNLLAPSTEGQAAAGSPARCAGDVSPRLFV